MIAYLAKNSIEKNIIQLEYHAKCGFFNFRSILCASVSTISILHNNRTNAKNDLFASREYNEKPRDRVTSENIESLSPSVLGKNSNRYLVCFFKATKMEVKQRKFLENPEIVLD